MLQIVLLLDYTILLYWFQTGQLVILIIYCGLVINYTKVYQKQIGPQITAFENTYDFHIGHEFFGRIRKDKADNNIGSTLEKATFSVIQENKTD